MRICWGNWTWCSSASTGLAMAAATGTPTGQNCPYLLFSNSLLLVIFLLLGSAKHQRQIALKMERAQRGMGNTKCLPICGLTPA